jgi:hypothetical protein
MATDNQQNHNTNGTDGSMTTREAGEKGGQRVRELIEEGKQSEQHGSSSSSQGFGERAGNQERKTDSHQGGSH